VSPLFPPSCALSMSLALATRDSARQLPSGMHHLSRTSPPLGTITPFRRFAGFMRSSCTCTLGKSGSRHPTGSALCLVVRAYPQLRPGRFTASRTRFFVTTSVRVSVIAEDLLFSTGSMILRNLRSSRLNQALWSATLLRRHLNPLFHGE